MDYFDSIKIFQKFFPHNNFDKVIQRAKEKAYLKKKLVKFLNISKLRRTNIIGIQHFDLNKSNTLA